jgi:hypothetical protein
LSQSECATLKKTALRAQAKETLPNKYLFVVDGSCGQVAEISLRAIESRLEFGLRLSRGFGGGEQSGLLMRTAATERDTLPMRMKSSLRL